MNWNGPFLPISVVSSLKCMADEGNHLDVLSYGEKCRCRIRNHKSLAPYRECRGPRSSHNDRNLRPRTFDRGDLKEWPMQRAMELLSIPFAMSGLQEG